MLDVTGRLLSESPMPAPCALSPARRIFGSVSKLFQSTKDAVQLLCNVELDLLTGESDKADAMRGGGMAVNK